MLGDRLVLALIAAYVLISLVYAWQQDWWRALYFLSATGISIAVVRMR